MDEGAVLCLRMLLGIIMFGLHVGVIAIIWKEVGSFVCGLVETFKVREPSEDIVDGEEVGSFEGGSVETVKVREPSEDIVDGEDEPNCVLAMDEDFSGTDNGEFRYIGSSDCVKIPHVIKDDEMTSYHKITDMSYMFNSIQDTEVDLSNFDTTTEEDLSYMLEVKPQN